MSHFTVLVAGDDPDAALAPFQEDLVVPRYLAKTRADLIEGERAYIASIRDTSWSDYQANPAAYIAANRNNPGHVRYFTGGEFEAKLSWSDEQLYAAAIRWTDAYWLDEDGNEWSTDNPRAQWDWWTVGGRWSGGLRTRDGREADTCRRDELSVEGTEPTFAVLIGDDWHERGSMGWFGVVSNKEDDQDWNLRWLKLVAALPGSTLLTLVDAHI